MRRGLGGRQGSRQGRGGQRREGQRGGGHGGGAAPREAGKAPMGGVEGGRPPPSEVVSRRGRGLGLGVGEGGSAAPRRDVRSRPGAVGVRWALRRRGLLGASP